MFDDARRKKIVLVAHCLLNQNSISDGTADRASQFDEIVEFLMANHIGMIQMPCPEFLCLGLDRGDADGSKRPLLEENTRIRELLGEPRHVATLRRKADDLVTQIREYEAYGFQVLGVIGVDRSPSCGVATTSRGGAETPGKGLFLEVLSETLAEHEITLPMIGTKTHEPEASLEKVRQLVDGPLVDHKEVFGRASRGGRGRQGE
jgi:predicted secreted protein